MMRPKFLSLLMLGLVACAPTATQTTSTSAVTTPVPMWYEGQWTAPGVQLNLSSGTEGAIGTLVRPELQCAANLTVLSRQDNQLVARQDPLYGGTNCNNTQLVVIRRNGSQTSINFGANQSDLPLVAAEGSGSTLIKGGVYNALAVQRNPAGSFSVQLVVSSTAKGMLVSAIYPEQGCASRLQFVRNEGNQARYTEKMVHGTCLDGGTIRLDVQAGTGNLRYLWSKDQVPATVEAFFRPGALPKK